MVAFDPVQPHLLEQHLLQQAVPLPVVVTGAMHDWPARSWSVQHLQQFGFRIVPVEISHNGGDYRDLHAPASDRHFEADVGVPLALLLESMQAAKERQSPFAKEKQSPVLLYAAQVDLISLIPELESGIRTPPLSAISDRLYKRNTWLGPPGTSKEYPDFPGFSEVPYLEHHLQPGEMLFIPKKYWHFIQALDISWSVSYWWT
ncbi:Lysine-specific demethylase 8 [Trebouxia sp. C0009 RCD-2024]